MTKRTDTEIQELRDKYPSVPAYAIPTHRTKKKNKTNELQTQIIEHVKRMGGYGFRINTMGTYSEALGKYIRNGSTNGVSDVVICFDGLLIACEVKRSRGDKQRPDQIKFQKAIEQAGGKYFICGSMESFEVQFNAIINSI